MEGRVGKVADRNCHAVTQKLTMYETAEGRLREMIGSQEQSWYSWCHRRAQMRGAAALNGLKAFCKNPDSSHICIVDRVISVTFIL